MKTYYTISCRKCGHVEKDGMATINRNISGITCKGCGETDVLRYGILTEDKKRKGNQK